METTRLIEEYIEGHLSEAERLDVEKRLATDADFRRLFDLHKEVNESITDDGLYDLHQKINKVITERNEHPAGGFKMYFPYFKYAALFVLIAGSAVLSGIILSRSQGQRLFNRYYEPYVADIITRADDPVNDLARAVLFYNQKEYREAHLVLTGLTSANPKDYVAWYFLGITSMQMRDFDDAIHSFTVIPDDWNNPYNEHRRWYEALAFLRTNNTSLSKEKLNRISADKGYYSHQADLILSSLR